MRNASKILIVVLAALSVGACVNREQASDMPPGDSISVPAPDTSSSETEPPESTSASDDPETAVECTADDVVVTGAPDAKPVVTLPTNCSPPTTLLSKDITAGTGPEAVQGSTMQANYLLITWSDGKELDTSWSAAGGQPLPVENLGQAQVIDGWNEGLPGMHQGGRRLLLVPADKGYGEAGQGQVQPNETLVFVVDAVQVTGP